MHSETSGMVPSIFKIMDDHTVLVNIAGEKKSPPSLKEKTTSMRNAFNEGRYHAAI